MSSLAAGGDNPVNNYNCMIDNNYERSCTCIDVAIDNYYDMGTVLFTVVNHDHTVTSILNDLINMAL